MAVEGSEPASGKLKTFRVVSKKEQNLWDWICLSPIPYFCPYILVAAFFVGIHYQNYWLVMWLAFCLIPTLDILLPTDISHPDPADPNLNLDSVWYKIPLYLWTPATILVVMYGSYIAATLGNSMSWYDYAGMCLSAGALTGGLGITVAHELLHKQNERHEVAMAFIILLHTNYMHFVREHIHGHHKRVATKEDPACAHDGESFYSFYLKTVPGCWKSSWDMVVRELNQKNLPVFSIHNEMLWFIVIPIMYSALLMYAWGSWRALVYFHLQGWFGFSLLEIVNYVEHWDLKRKKLPNGNYEPVNVLHSWNAPHTITNFFLFKLQRHSDHHAHAARPYQYLRNFEESPQLPTGYAGMVILALFPPLYKHLVRPCKDSRNSAASAFLANSVILALIVVPNLIFYFTPLTNPQNLSVDTISEL